jgi:hypothetical protein
LQLTFTLMSQKVLRHLAVPDQAPLDKRAEEAENRRLAVAAKFSSEQKRVLVALRGALYTNLGRLQRRRERLTAELQVQSSLVLTMLRSPVSDCVLPRQVEEVNLHRASLVHALYCKTPGCRIVKQALPCPCPCSRCCNPKAIPMPRRGKWLRRQRLWAVAGRFSCLSTTVMAALWRLLML